MKNKKNTTHTTKEEAKAKIEKIEKQMLAPDFWNDRKRAQGVIKELNELKTLAEGGDKYAKSNAIITIFSGAGGDDAEDFSRILYDMYGKFIDKMGWKQTLIHENKNDHGGYRNITFEVDGKGDSGLGAYGMLKNESGVHRLVRISPFNANKKRHTSFSMVEVVPKLPDIREVDLKDEDLEISFAKSSGPGGQNVNKRDTAVRVTHIPTKISVHAEGERSQAQNKERALEILAGKLYKKREENRKREEKGLSVSSTTSIEWGNQIRSYVLHPYKLVKDHRSGVESRDADAVLNGDLLGKFIEAERSI